MHSEKLLSLALSLFVAVSVVASPCKPHSSATSTTLSESTTTILSVSPSTGSETVGLDTSLATSQANTATKTSESVTDTATTLATSTIATAVVDTTTTASETTTTAVELTTTAEEETTTTAEAACAQSTFLSNPTPIFASDSIHDDEYRPVEVPFPVGVFDSYSSTVYVSTNGLLSLGSGSVAYANRELPTATVPSISIVPYWSDLYIIDIGLCGIGITYEVHQTSRGQTFTVEYYLGGGGGSGSSNHFTVSFYEDFPELVRYVYYKTATLGKSATVGLQNGQLFSQFSFNTDGSIPDQSWIEIITSNGVAITTSGQL